jgi:hypothetical protein
MSGPGRAYLSIRAMWRRAAHHCSAAQHGCRQARTRLWLNGTSASLTWTDSSAATPQGWIEAQRS